MKTGIYVHRLVQTVTKSNRRFWSQRDLNLAQLSSPNSSYSTLYGSPASNASSAKAIIFNSRHNLKIGCFRFVPTASGGAKCTECVGGPGQGAQDSRGASDDVKTMEDVQGKLSPTSSHLFKLILPLTPPSSFSVTKPPPPTVFLLHPSQPLSHVAHLIETSMRPALSVSFRSVSPDESGNKEVEWSNSTDIGDFIKSAVIGELFTIVLTPASSAAGSRTQGDTYPDAFAARSITVRVPSFRDRTRFLRRRLRMIEDALHNLEQIKSECDTEAHRGARRLALGGFGILIAYWVGVARLTFYDYGWDVMEPVTYLSGLSTVICGYLWFLYKGRELSYTSVLNQSVSKRRDALYKSRGLDIERWVDLITERKALRREMEKVAEDYDMRWDGH